MEACAEFTKSTRKFSIGQFLTNQVINPSLSSEGYNRFFREEFFQNEDIVLRLSIGHIQKQGRRAACSLVYVYISVSVNIFGGD